MANTNGAFGLRPIGVVGQGYNTTGATEYRIAAGNTNAIYQGSPVIPLSTGFIDIVGAATGGTVGLVGVFAGAEYVSSTTGEKVFSNFWPGSGADTKHPPAFTCGRSAGASSGPRSILEKAKRGWLEPALCAQSEAGAAQPRDDCLDMEAVAGFDHDL